MTPEQLEKVEQIGRVAAMLSPLVLFLSSAVRRWAAKLVALAWAPVTAQFERRDRVLREVRDALAELREGMQQTRSSVTVLAAASRMRSDLDPDTGYFECDGDGQNVYVSATYARWMGVSTAELLRWGFLNYTAESDRERVIREWALAREQHREYREIVSMGPVGGPYKRYMVTVQPIPDAPPALAWVGSLKPAAK